MRQIFWLLSLFVTYGLAYFATTGSSAATVILFIIFLVLGVNNLCGISIWKDAIAYSPGFRALAENLRPPAPLWLISLGNVGVCFLLVFGGAFWLAGLGFLFAATEYELYDKAEKLKTNE